MSITDKIAKHYQASISGELKKIHVEEWDTDIYCRTTYPLKDEATILQLQTEGKTVEAVVESIIVKARDKDGKRLFHDADRIKLMNEADPLVIIKVGGAINNAKLDLDQETASKE
jgi:hypothetical protein|tara:strand:- start:6932 stop:7276 length:345 start_codon:yes stop_codon:yes gene_type:complete